MEFSEFVDSLEAANMAEFRGSDWAEHWDDQWVAFADLIGFADRSVHEDTIMHQVVKFHRALTACNERYSEVHLLPFTDSAYAAASNLTTLLKWAISLQNHCLGVNALHLRSGLKLFHAMLIPRITIAHGRLLRASPALEASEQARGVLAQGLFIGEAVVRAYRIERSSAGSMISLSDEHAPTVRALPSRGVQQNPLFALDRWRAGDLVLEHDGVIDVPWVLLRPVQPDDDALWAENRLSVLEKLRILNEVWELSLSEFIVRGLPNSTIKHFGAVKRHLAEVVAALGGGRAQTIAWTTEEFSTRIGRV